MFAWVMRAAAVAGKPTRDTSPQGLNGADLDAVATSIVNFNANNGPKVRCGKVLLLAATLTACSSGIDQAEREYEMAKRNGATSLELCRRDRAIEEAYLKAQREEEYRRQKLHADIHCQNAELGG